MARPISPPLYRAWRFAVRMGAKRRRGNLEDAGKARSGDHVENDTICAMLGQRGGKEGSYFTV